MNPADHAIAIAPSLMCADMGALAEELRSLEDVGCDLVHLDVMDAHFAPNMPLGLGVIESLRPRTRLPFDVHLMVENNDWFVDRVASIGVERITVHQESCVHLDRTLSVIRDRGCLAGVALNPATPVETLRYVVGRIDFVLIMTVNPGFAGQRLVPSALRKIADCRRFLDEHGSSAPISVDGNVSFENIPAMVAAGADILVAGTSSLYHSGGTRAENAQRTRRVIADGLRQRIESRAS